MMSDVNGFDAANTTDPAAPDAGLDTPSILVERLPDTVVLKVGGEIDMMTAPGFEDAVRQALSETPATLIVDLSGAQFFSSAGIAVLLLAHHGSDDVALRVVADDHVVLRPLELTGLAEDFAIYPTLQAALDG
jgi:anti-sigma B factor antagonist